MQETNEEEQKSGFGFNENLIPETTSKVERMSWYLYEFGMHVLTSACLYFILPLLLDYLAFNAGSGYPAPILRPGDPPSLLPDFKTIAISNSTWFQPGSCVEGNILNFTLSDQEYYGRCVVPWAGGYIRHTSWALNIISVSVGIQAFCFITLGSLADHGNYRKSFLIIFTYVGVAASLLFIYPFTNSNYWLAGVFACILNAAIGVAGVFYNSFLPLLAAADPELLCLSDQDKSDPVVYQKKTEAVSNRLSTHGLAIGFSSGTLFSILAAGLTVYLGQPFGLQVATVLCGVWWGCMLQIVVDINITKYFSKSFVRIYIFIRDDFHNFLKLFHSLYLAKNGLDHRYQLVKII
ncbi:Autophagy protein 22 [Nowakowskiella sp. JEL0078]|nr:Autophagy protein 22 [Nowakowskiella sp. JEL0078]